MSWLWAAVRISSAGTVEMELVQSVTLVDLDAKIIELAKMYEPLVKLNEGALLDTRVRSESELSRVMVPRLYANEHALGALRTREPVAKVRTVASMQMHT